MIHISWSIPIDIYAPSKHLLKKRISTMYSSETREMYLKDFHKGVVDG